MFWEGLIVGLFFGANVGLVVVALFSMSKKDDSLNKNPIMQDLSFENCDEIKKLCENCGFQQNNSLAA
jgi:hypothetical protein